MPRFSIPRRCAASATFAALLAAFLVSGAAPAVAAPANAPSLVAPAASSTVTGTSTELQVMASDPDTSTLAVDFYGREAGTTVEVPSTGEDFTFTVLPDTQNYTWTTFQETIRAQADWIVANRSRLNIQFVSQLGDLVSTHTNTTQWQRVSDRLGVLDAAGVPNTVLPGNHDFDYVTGEVGLYNQYFPPSRYSNANWTPASARYGGYLGQNLFGPDPVDRGNMNNFALFTAGGTDYLVLSLEFGTPAYTVEWSRKVLAAYPDRKVILVTHAFINYNSVRPTVAERPNGGISPQQLWTDLVFPNCSIVMVLNGHYHLGDDGEGLRSDPNTCGTPVPQILTDYQERANGGNGWMRYYTFRPSQSQIEAVTYSPTLDQYETDADSAFTVPFPMGSTQPAPFTLLGTDTVASGGTASVDFSGLEPETGYEWYAVVRDGGTPVTGATWGFSTSPPTTYATDSFTRALAAGWGVADSGQPWLSSGGTGFSAAGGAGRLTAAAGGTKTMTLPAVSAADVSVGARFSLDKAGTGSGTYLSFLARQVGTDSYRAKVRYLAGGAVNLSLIRYQNKTDVSLASLNVPGLSVVPGDSLSLRFEVSGTSPTTLRARLWRTGQPEPTTWTVTATDSTAVLQQAGVPGVSLYVSGSATAVPVTAAIDDLVFGRLGVAPPPPPPPPPPANVAPVAVIASPVVTGRDVQLSGAGSSDSDGTLTGYSWNFGDGTPAGSGPTVSHTYAADGTYSVVLTVTDDDGATATATVPVTVALAPPPPPPPPPASGLASDDFERAVTAGWGTADSGGPWLGAGSASRYAVGAGVGAITVAPGATAEVSLRDLQSAGSELRAQFSVSSLATGGSLYASFEGRRVDAANDYRAKVILEASGRVQLQIVRKAAGAETVLTNVFLPAGFTHSAGNTYAVAVQAVGASPTTVRAKVWLVGTTEPAWQLTTTDSTAALQRAGSVGVLYYASRSFTGASSVLRVDALRVTAP